MGVKQLPNTVPELFQLNTKEWQAECRELARKMLRQKPHITIEDVLAVYPRPKYIKPNATGGVFQHPDFKAVGFAPSKRQISHGRFVRQWALSNPNQTNEVCEEPSIEIPVSFRAYKLRNREAE